MSVDPLLSLGLSEVGADVSVVGFGTTNTTTKAWADVLQMANIKVVSSSSCYSTAASSFLWSIKGDQICARGEEMEPSRRCFRDSCQVPGPATGPSPRGTRGGPSSPPTSAESELGGSLFNSSSGFWWVWSPSARPSAAAWRTPGPGCTPTSPTTGTGSTRR